MKILIIEDDAELAKTMRDELQQDYIVDVCFTGQEGEYLAEMNEYDLIIADLILPDTNGVNVCQTIRRLGITTPILMLTGINEVGKKVDALDAGADDYLIKPFNFKELKARLRALSRRRHSNLTNNVLQLEDLKLDSTNRVVQRGEAVIELRRKEFDLLEYLLRNRGKVVTREMILNHVWENTYDAFTNTVDVHIKYLRDRVDKPYKKKLIRTVHGLGYKIES
jgi:DNA-binding response OmpR family regulator